MSRERIQAITLELDDEEPFERTPAGVRKGLRRLAVKLGQVGLIDEARIERGRIGFKGMSFEFADPRVLWLTVEKDGTTRRLDPHLPTLDDQLRFQVADYLADGKAIFGDDGLPKLAEHPGKYPLGNEATDIESAGVVYVPEMTISLERTI